MTVTALARQERVRQSPPTARELVEVRLEPGEPIEALLRVATTGPLANPTAANVVGVANVGTLGTSGPAVTALQRTVTIALTDRRVFFVHDATSAGVRVEDREAVRVLEYDTTAPTIRLWLNLDGHQTGFLVPASLRNATDALVQSLGGAPPSLTRPDPR